MPCLQSALREVKILSRYMDRGGMMNNETEQTATALLNELMEQIKTIHLDMGGDHRYALSHMAHKVISKIRAWQAKQE